MASIRAATSFCIAGITVRASREVGRKLARMQVIDEHTSCPEPGLLCAPATIRGSCGARLSSSEPEASIRDRQPTSPAAFVRRTLPFRFPGVEASRLRAAAYAVGLASLS
jgi:hypothetical protein